MPACPVCFGEGSFDHRDDDAWFAEHHSDAELERMEALGFVRRVGIVSCDECEGTGVVSAERRAEILDAAYRRVMAIIDAEERRGRGSQIAKKADSNASLAARSLSE